MGVCVCVRVSACGMVGAFRRTRTHLEVQEGRCSRGKRDRPGVTLVLRVRGGRVRDRACVRSG